MSSLDLWLVIALWSCSHSRIDTICVVLNLDYCKLICTRCKLIRAVASICCKKIVLDGFVKSIQFSLERLNWTWRDISNHANQNNVTYWCYYWKQLNNLSYWSKEIMHIKLYISFLYIWLYYIFFAMLFEIKFHSLYKQSLSYNSTE